MTAGGFNSSYHLSEVSWVEMITSPYYGIQANGLKVDGVDSGLVKSDFSNSFFTGTIVDSGTTFTYLCYAVYKTLYQMFDEFCKSPGKCLGKNVKVVGEPHPCYTFDNETHGNLKEFFSSFPEVKVLVDKEEVTWKPERYLFAWPDSPLVFCVGVYNNGGTGNILGGNFMRGNDVIFDRGLMRMGFALSDCGVSWDDSFGEHRALKENRKNGIVDDDFRVKTLAFIGFGSFGTFLTVLGYFKKRNFKVSNEYCGQCMDRDVLDGQLSRPEV
jgi:hypothetical protein